MKDAFQQQHEEEGETVIGPMGRPMMSPEAMQRKIVRDRLKQEEVRILSDLYCVQLRSESRKRGSGKRGSRNSLRTSRTNFPFSPRQPRIPRTERYPCRSGKSVDLRQSESIREAREHNLKVCRDLKEESYGVDMLHAIGRAYQAKATQHAASEILVKPLMS